MSFQRNSQVMTIRNADAPTAQNHDINSRESRTMIAETLSYQTLDQITVNRTAIVLLGNGEAEATMLEPVIPPQQGKKTIG